MHILFGVSMILSNPDTVYSKDLTSRESVQFGKIKIVMISIEITGRKTKPGVAKMPTGISPEGDPNNQIGETRSGGKNSPQALIFFSSRE